ncbi:hypothetical protein ACFSN5_08060 [Streptococcus tangpeifui]|uniref:hypothetical protein n=1 Tax=Streptococcus tangpeifui TaxID=2709400 RepID=UPI0013EAE939|nr:hypothetical protein [Streptococcus sp. ZJ1593]
MDLQEWKRFFEDVNHRQPSQDEVKAAIEAGVVSPMVHASEPSFGSAGLQSAPSQSAARERLGQGGAAQSAASNGQPSSPTSWPPNPQNKTELGQSVNQVQPQFTGNSAPTMPASPPKKKAKWAWGILGTLVGLLILVGLVFGGYAWWRMESGNIEGTWQMTSQKYYDDGEWIDALKEYKDHDYTFSSCMTVDSQNNLNEYTYYYDNDLENYPIISVQAYLKNYYHVDKWNKRITVSLSKSDLRGRIKKTLKKKFRDYYHYTNEDSLDDDLENIIETYDNTISYTVDGDRLEVITKNKSGKIVQKTSYKRLSSSKASELRKIFNNVKAKFEDNYNIH